MTSEEKKQMMAEAMKEIEAAVDSGNMVEVYTTFMEALKTFDVNKAIDSMVIMYDVFTPETYAALGVFFDKVGTEWQIRSLEFEDERLEKAKRIEEIMENMMDDEDEES